MTTTKPSPNKPSIVIAGAGIFGVTAALALCQRGHPVTLVDPGPLPHPLAASTDISKVVRMEYGADAAYVELMEQALRGFRRWNQEFGEVLYHEVGVAFLCQDPLSQGGFEGESLRTLRARGHEVTELSQSQIAKRFPAWNASEFPFGIHNQQGGYAESGRVVERLLQKAVHLGVRVLAGVRLLRLHEESGSVKGIWVFEDAERLIEADEVVVSAGAWTPVLLPELEQDLTPCGQPVFHLRPSKEVAPLFEATRFPVFGGDISRLGYYGFPLHPHSGVVKVANHGVGRILRPDQERQVNEDQVADLRRFLRRVLPTLAEAEIVYTRLCLYCDTADGHFLIDRLRPGLTVAAGGSGHAFKFAPVLGELIAKVVAGEDFPLARRFAHRAERRAAGNKEAARNR